MFTGYSDETVDFFWELRFNNNREWFQPRKEQFNRVIMTPTKALANDLFDWFTEKYPELHLNCHVSRIYRDARRLFGRGPYKDHIWFSFANATEQREHAPCFWFELGAEGYRYGMGSWMQAADAAAFRKLIDRKPEVMTKLAADFDRQTEFTLGTEPYARAKGHENEILAPWYNSKSIDLHCSRSYDACSYGPELVQRLQDACTFLIPYYRFLDEACHLAD